MVGEADGHHVGRYKGTREGHLFLSTYLDPSHFLEEPSFLGDLKLVLPFGTFKKNAELLGTIPLVTFGVMT